MANVKISELPQATSVGTNDIVPIVQDGTTKQATAGMISPPIATSITSSSTNNEVAGAKAVYDELQLKANHDNVAKDFWYGTQAQYDALATKDATTIYMTDEDTTTPIATTINENSTNSEIAGAKAVYDNSLEVYSTTEQRVGTWIDGKPLYQIVLTGTCPTYSTSTITTDIDIASNVDFAFIENQFVVASSGNCFVLPRTKYYVDDVGQDVVDNSTTGRIMGSTKKYRITQNSTNSNGYTYYAIIRYTKTTD